MELQQISLKMPPSSLGNHMGRFERLGGEDYQVYPCVMLVEGVHQGVDSDPVYYSPNMLAESAPKWNNLPITVGHPVNQQGQHVLCNDDGTIRTQWQIGYLQNVYFEDGKLKADLYINVRYAQGKAPELLSFLQRGGELQVSTGMLAALDGNIGTWNGEDYVGSVTTVIPDHLALLPGGKGACSWADGCGVRANEAETTDDISSQTYIQEENDMADNTEEKCCPEAVAALIANEATPFVEDDKEWLESLNEEQLNKLVVNEEPVVEEEPEPLTLKAFIESAPVEWQPMLNGALEAYDEKRQGFMDKILNHEGSEFTEEQLKDMDDAMLKGIASMVPEEKKTKFTGANPNNNNVITNETKVEPYIPVTVNDVMLNGKEEK